MCKAGPTYQQCLTTSRLERMASPAGLKGDASLCAAGPGDPQAYGPQQATATAYCMEVMAMRQNHAKQVEAQQAQHANSGAVLGTLLIVGALLVCGAAYVAGRALARIIGIWR